MNYQGQQNAKKTNKFIRPWNKDSDLVFYVPFNIKQIGHRSEEGMVIIKGSVQNVISHEKMRTCIMEGGVYHWDKGNQLCL